MTNLDPVSALPPPGEGWPGGPAPEYKKEGDYKMFVYFSPHAPTGEIVRLLREIADRIERGKPLPKERQSLRDTENNSIGCIDYE